MKFWNVAIAAVAGAAVFLFWWLLYPQWLNYHEQYQLFLFTGSYFKERIGVAGGLADYVSEFLVQFFYVKWLGALVMAGMFLLMSKAGRSYLPALLLFIFMGDQDVLLSFMVSMTAAMFLCEPFRRAGWHLLWSAPLLWWLIGPAAYVPLLYAALKRCGLAEAASALFLALFVYMMHRTALAQYPLVDVICGINYFRLPFPPQPFQYVVPTVAIAVMLAEPYTSRWKGTPAAASIYTAVLLAGSFFCTRFTFVKDNYEQIAYDWLIREERWNEVVERAEKYQPKTEFSASAVNLALFMTGQMDKRFFQFYQCGTEGLLVPRHRDLLTNMPTTEAYWRLGFINSTFRFMFDMQEATGNNRKSGRCTKRMVEALIVNGWYEVAEKYIYRLENTVFYRGWAKELRTYLWNEKKVDSNMIYAYLRRVRFKEEFLFYYPEMGKMLLKLYHNDKNNIMAAYYAQAFLQLKRMEEGAL